MKIAIQGHPIRGKEVIKILESLGGKNEVGFTGTYSSFYYINDKNEICDDHKKNIPLTYEFYTLEEFEDKFPFKIGDEVMFPVTKGWLSGKIIGLDYAEDQLKYKIHNRIGGYSYVKPHKLSLYPMKEERNITLTLDKAKEWYKKGGELKEIALQAFTERELNPLPRSWEEFCEKYPVKRGECSLESKDVITVIPCDCRGNRIYKSWIPSKKSAEAHLAMIQLEQLRNCWWNGWEPNWLEGNIQKYVIQKWRDKISIETTYVTHSFLSFPTYEMAKEFLECFRDLIEKANDLI